MSWQSRSGLRIAMAAGFLIWLVAVGGPPTIADEETVRPEIADRDVLRQAMLEARIETTQPRPGLSLYVRDAATAFSQHLAQWMERVLPRFVRRAAPLLEPVMMFLLGLLALILVILLVRVAFTHRRRRPVEAPPVQDLGAADAPPAGRDWESELRRHLDHGDAPAAIEALWWWLATGLAGDRAQPSWTSRELVVQAGRRELLKDVRRLDRMMYGAVQPSTSDVGRLWHDLWEAVG